MTLRTEILESRYLNRRKSIVRKIKGEIAFFFSSPEKTESRDLHYPYRQDSDFLYLTGLEEPKCVLVLLGSSHGPRSILYLRDRNSDEERWVGDRLGIKRAKRKFDVDEIRNIDTFALDLPTLLSNTQVIHYAAGSNDLGDSLIWGHLRTPVGPRVNFPHTIKDSRLITSEMRVVKDRDEIRSLRHACSITARAFLEFSHRLKDVKSEKHGAKLMEGLFARFGAQGTSFPTIVASGKNATVLHHTPRFQPLWKQEMVLVDAGALFNGYAGDITRTLPVSGRFTEAQSRVYDVVHNALSEGISVARPGSSLDDIHQFVVRAITRGLLELKVLKGNVSDLIANSSYKKYYMHRSGHHLGLDVHDISPQYYKEVAVPVALRPLELGNVFTIEPGLYFDPKDTSVPKQFRGIGVRLEEDVLITSSGCEVLTNSMPVAREDVEKIFSS